MKRSWFPRDPRLADRKPVHPCAFHPASASCLNLVGVCFGIIERQAIHRGKFGSVRDLTWAIRTYINAWNKRAHLFVWTNTAYEILKKGNCQPISNTGPLGLFWRRGLPRVQLTRGV